MKPSKIVDRGNKILPKDGQGENMHVQYPLKFLTETNNKSNEEFKVWGLNLEMEMNKNNGLASDVYYMYEINFPQIPRGFM